MSWPRVGARTVGALLVGLAGLAAAPAGAAGQEAGSAGEEAEPRGWLGVGLRDARICSGDALPGRQDRLSSERCRRALVVEAVVEGSPAAKAGLQPGDTLVALDGTPLTGRRGGAALRSLGPGEAVTLLIGRDGGRQRLRAVPGERPPEADRLRLVTPLAPGPRGTVTVPPGLVLRWSRSLEGVEAPEELAREISSRGLRVDRQGRVYLRGEGDQMVRLRGVEASRIRALRDSMMRHARARLEAARARLRRAGAPEAPQANLARPPRPAVVRAAGAEFRPLEPGLAEYFRGVERGLLVLRVVRGTPAGELGLRPGDVVVEAAGQATVRPGQLLAAFREMVREDSLVVRWVRKGEAMTGTIRPR